MGRRNSIQSKSNRLVLYPAPDTALTLRLYYSPRVTEMSLSTDIPNVPVHYHEFISVLAARDGFIKDGRDNQAIFSKNGLLRKKCLRTMQKKDKRTLQGPLYKQAKSRANYLGSFKWVNSTLELEFKTKAVSSSQSNTSYSVGLIPKPVSMSTDLKRVS